jgi:hypothetical protein
VSSRLRAFLNITSRTCTLEFAPLDVPSRSKTPIVRTSFLPLRTMMRFGWNIRRPTGVDSIEK